MTDDAVSIIAVRTRPAFIVFSDDGVGKLKACDRNPGPARPRREQPPDWHADRMALLHGAGLPSWESPLPVRRLETSKPIECGRGVCPGDAARDTSDLVSSSTLAAGQWGRQGRAIEAQTDTSVLTSIRARVARASLTGAALIGLLADGALRIAPGGLGSEISI